MKLIEAEVMVVLCGILTVVNAGTYEDRQRLQKDLMKKMDTGIRPIFNQSNTINVNLLPLLMQIQGLEEKPQLFFSTFVLQFSWMMEILQWDPSKYGGIKSVHLSPKHAWIPDIVYQNTINNLFEIKNGEKMKITVTSNGFSKWTTGGNLISHCPIAVQDYPFDKQACKIVIGKMYSNDNEMMIIPNTNKLDLGKYKENDEWLLTNTDVRYTKIQDGMHFVVLEASVKRRPMFHVFNVILPLVLLSFMNVLTFKLPVSSGERIGYCVSMLLTFCVFLNNVSGSIPRVSQSISYLQLYASIQLASGILTTALSIYLMNLAQYRNEENVPCWIRSIYNCTSRIRVRRSNIHPNIINVQDSEMANRIDEHGDENPQKAQECGTYHKTGVNIDEAMQLLDHLCFWLFLLFFLVSTLTLLLKMLL